MFDNLGTALVQALGFFAVFGFFVYQTLYADSTEQETSADSVELLSNGFVFRDNSSAQNAAAGYAFWAFAEEPLVASNKDVVTAG